MGALQIDLQVFWKAHAELHAPGNYSACWSSLNYYKCAGLTTEDLYLQPF